MLSFEEIGNELPDTEKLKREIEKDKETVFADPNRISLGLEMQKKGFDDNINTFPEMVEVTDVTVTYNDMMGCYKIKAEGIYEDLIEPAELGQAYVDVNVKPQAIAYIDTDGGEFESSYHVQLPKDSPLLDED